MGMISFGSDPITGQDLVPTGQAITPGLPGPTVNASPGLIQNSPTTDTGPGTTNPPVPVNTDNGGSAYNPPPTDTGTTPAPTDTGTTPAPTGGTTPSGGIDWTSIFGTGAGLWNAYQQNQQAGQIANTAQGYANQLNPYGGYRAPAAQALANLQADPSSVVNTPGYKFALSQELGSIFNRDNKSFGVGAGSTNPDAMNYAEGLASKTYNDTVSQLSAQAGVNIGPSAAGGVLQQSLAGQYNALNSSAAAATNALTSPGMSNAINAVGQYLKNAGLNGAQIAAAIKGLFPNGTDPGTGANGGYTVPGTGMPTGDNGTPTVDNGTTPMITMPDGSVVPLVPSNATSSGVTSSGTNSGYNLGGTPTNVNFGPIDPFTGLTLGS